MSFFFLYRTIRSQSRYKIIIFPSRGEKHTFWVNPPKINHVILLLNYLQNRDDIWYSWIKDGKTKISIEPEQNFIASKAEKYKINCMHVCEKDKPVCNGIIGIA